MGVVFSCGNSDKRDNNTVDVYILFTVMSNWLSENVTSGGPRLLQKFEWKYGNGNSHPTRPWNFKFEIKCYSLLYFWIEIPIVIENLHKMW